jgi:hypothetical protein
MAYLESTLIHYSWKIFTKLLEIVVRSITPRILHLPSCSKGASTPIFYICSRSLALLSIGILLPNCYSIGHLRPRYLPKFPCYVPALRVLELYRFPTCIFVLATNMMVRFVSTSRLARPPVRDVQEFLGLHLFGTRQRSGVPNRSRLRIRWVGSGECCNACLYGVPQLFRQRRYAGAQWRCPRTACQ